MYTNPFFPQAKVKVFQIMTKFEMLKNLKNKTCQSVFYFQVDRLVLSLSWLQPPYPLADLAFCPDGRVCPLCSGVSGSSRPLPCTLQVRVY